jgi:predicted transcriptional regulator
MVKWYGAGNAICLVRILQYVTLYYNANRIWCMTSTTFSMRMNADMKRKLEDEAAREDRSAAWMAQQAIEQFLDDREFKRQAIREAIAEADKGVFISGEAVERWMGRWADGHEEPFPEADIFPDADKVIAAE